MCSLCSALSAACILHQLLLLWAMLSFSGSVESRCMNGTLAISCSFYDDLCQWNSDRWTRHRFYPHYAKLDTYTYTSGNLVSRTVCSTRSRAHCLDFDYEFQYQYRPDAMLSVFVEEGPGAASKKIWTFSHSRSGIYTARVPLVTSSDFTIIIHVERPVTYTPGLGSFVTVANILYKQIACTTFPPDAQVYEKNASKATLTTTSTTTTATTTTTTTTTITARPTTASALKVKSSPGTLIKPTLTIDIKTSSFSPAPKALNTTLDAKQSARYSTNEARNSPTWITTPRGRSRSRTSISAPSTSSTITTTPMRKASQESVPPGFTRPVRKFLKESVPRTFKPIFLSTETAPDMGDNMDDRRKVGVVSIVIGVIVALVVLAVVLIAFVVVKRRQPACFFDRKGEADDREKAMSRSSWHYEDTDIAETNSPHVTSDTLSIDPNQDSGYYSVVRDIPIQSSHPSRLHPLTSQHQVLQDAGKKSGNCVKGSNHRQGDGKGGDRRQCSQTMATTSSRSPVTTDASARSVTTPLVEEYKTLSFEREDGDVLGGDIADGHLYNHLESTDVAVVRLCSKEATTADRRTKHAAESGVGVTRAQMQEGKQRCHGTRHGDYNNLNFAAGQRKSGGKLYDHIRVDDSDDMYSQVHRDRRPLVVLGSEYSHIRPDMKTH